MILFKKKNDILDYLRKQKIRGKQIGFVPTMGALHPGHISLVRRARADCDITVCSIFVNPTQFNDPNDLARYPRTIETDIRMLTEASCDVLFYPDKEEMYGDGLATDDIDLGNLDRVYEGEHRPGHFRGVTTIVKKLFEAVEPDKAFFGQKDIQQCLVIRKMVNILGLDTEIVICPTLREKNGLAMSSRNMRLSEEQRADASRIYEALQHIKMNAGLKPLTEARQEALAILQSIPGSRVEYFDVAEAGELKTLENWDETKEIVAVAAVYVGEVRLIDNLLINTD